MDLYSENVSEGNVSARPGLALYNLQAAPGKNSLASH